MASVFLSRLDRGMKLQSCASAYYGDKKIMGIDEFGDSHFPNHLFQTYIRERAYVPISLRSFYHTLSENEYEERLYLELVGFDDHGKGWWNFSYFLSEYTKFVNDFSDRTKRLRKISDLLWNKKIADEFMFYMKEVK